MARIRSIKPEFFTSETLASVSRDSRLLFIGLWPIADDYGCLLDIPRRILGDVFPHDKDMTDAQIDAMLSALAAAGLIVRHRLKKMAIIVVCGWDEHQKVDRPGKVRICSESDRVEALSRDTRETLATVSMLDLGSRTKDLGSTPPIPPEPQKLAGAGLLNVFNGSSLVMESAAFRRYMDAHPKQTHRMPARHAWNTAIIGGATVEQIMAGLQTSPRVVGASSHEKIVNPAVYLAECCWEDQPAPPEQSPEICDELRRLFAKPEKEEP